MRQETLTAAEWKAKHKRQPRFKRSPPEERTVEGHVFDSKLDAERYAQLRLEQRSGIVIWISIYPRFLLAGVVYTADFMYGQHLPQQDYSTVVVEEVKPSIQDPKARAEYLRAFRRNQKQMKELHKIEVVLIER